MKKLFKSLLMLLPMSMMVACASSQPVGEGQKNVVENENVEPAPVANNDVYLVLGKEGRYNGNAGQDIESKFLEYTVKFTGEVGSPLPGKDKITSTVKDVEFVSWISYENMGKPTVYDKVPEAKDKILYAFYKSTALPGHGNEGGGEVTPPVPDETVEILVNNTDWANVYIYAWTESGENIAKWPGLEMRKIGDHFAYDLPTKYDYVKFTDNLGHETRNFAMANYDPANNCFHVKADRWGKLSDTDLTKDPYVVYVIDKPADWSNDLYCYAWINDNTNNHGWPGIKMDFKDGKYSYTLPDGMLNLVFNDNNGKQTKNLTFNPDVGNVYSLKTNTWSKA